MGGGYPVHWVMWEKDERMTFTARMEDTRNYVVQVRCTKFEALQKSLRNADGEASKRIYSSLLQWAMMRMEEGPKPLLLI